MGAKFYYKGEHIPSAKTEYGWYRSGVVPITRMIVNSLCEEGREPLATSMWVRLYDRKTNSFHYKWWYGYEHCRRAYEAAVEDLEKKRRKLEGPSVAITAITCEGVYYELEPSGRM